MTPLADKVHRALVDLGDSPTTIAATLLGQGCRQDPEAALYAEGCPVSVYLRRLLGAEVRVSVDPWNAAVWDAAPAAEGDDWPDPTVVVTLPAAVSAWVRMYDRGAFPALGALVTPC